MSKDTSGSVFPCSVCDAPAVRKSGHQYLCAKHYRFGQMRHTSKYHGKIAPTRAELEEMPGANLECPECGTAMNWFTADGASTVATIQHYRDGTIAIVCKSCNTRHAFMDGDSYREMPKDHKLCPACKTIKPLSEFALDASRSGPAKRTSRCRTCYGEANKLWRESNREKYNAKQRAYRAKRKAAGNPVRRKS